MRRRADADNTWLSGAPNTNTPGCVSRLTGRSSLLLALLSLTGLSVWLAMSLTIRGGVSLPGSQVFSAVQSGWRAWSGQPSPVTTVSGIAGNTRSLPNAPFACASSGQNVVGSNLTIPSTEVVCGDVLVIGGSLNLQGDVRGSVTEIGGNATVSGAVTGDFTVIGGNLSVAQDGSIAGTAHDVGGQITTESNIRLVRTTDTTLSAPTDMVRAPGLDLSVDSGSFWLGLLFWLSAALGLCAVAPEMVGRVRYTISRHVALSGVLGALFGMVALVSAVVLVFTCLGIPLALFLAAAVWFGWVVGTVGFGAWIGSIIFGSPRRTLSLTMSALLGVLVLSILKALPIVGPIVTALSALIALGGATITLFSARRSPFALYKRY